MANGALVIPQQAIEQRLADLPQTQISPWKTALIGALLSGGGSAALTALINRKLLSPATALAGGAGGLAGGAMGYAAQRAENLDEQRALENLKTQMAGLGKIGADQPIHAGSAMSIIAQLGRAAGDWDKEGYWRGGVHYSHRTGKPTGKKKKKKQQPEKRAADMPSFTQQDRPGKVKDIYRALKRDHPGMPAEMKARIAARQGKPGKQKQGPAYKVPITEGYNGRGETKKSNTTADVQAIRHNPAARQKLAHILAAASRRAVTLSKLAHAMYRVKRAQGRNFAGGTNAVPLGGMTMDMNAGPGGMTGIPMTGMTATAMHGPKHKKAMGPKYAEGKPKQAMKKMYAMDKKGSFGSAAALLGALAGGNRIVHAHAQQLSPPPRPARPYPPAGGAFIQAMNADGVAS